ncbi:hypothetical protein PINS_up016550 [Pythium insidiosum]|nr:hypothetical protein PINS_up016550 [Pythium insidiosum]
MPARQATPRLALAILVGATLCALTAAWRQWTWRNSSGPGARSGHSLVFYKSELIVFGGRTLDTNKRHVPKTYDIQSVNGTLQFSTYEDKVARPSDDPTVRVGVFLNDVWSYDISSSRVLSVPKWSSSMTFAIATRRLHTIRGR